MTWQFQGLNVKVFKITQKKLVFRIVGYLIRSEAMVGKELESEK